MMVATKLRPLYIIERLCYSSEVSHTIYQHMYISDFHYLGLIVSRWLHSLANYPVVEILGTSSSRQPLNSICELCTQKNEPYFVFNAEFAMTSKEQGMKQVLTLEKKLK